MVRSISIERRIHLFLASFIVVTLGTVFAFSHLVRTSSQSARRQAELAHSSSRNCFELLDMVVKLQGLTQQLLSSNDPDEMEKLLGQNDGLVKEATTKVQQMGSGDGSVQESFGALVKANHEVQDLLFQARNIEARQLFIEKSNPAFQNLIASIKKYQDDMAGNLRSQAEQEEAHSSRIQQTTLVIAGGSILAMVALGAALGRSITRPLHRVVAMVQDIAEGEGDLTKRLESTATGEIGQLTEWFNIFMEKLEGVIRQVALNTCRLASASEEISATTTQQVRGAESQKEETDRVAASMQEMAQNMQLVSESADKAATEAQEAAGLARRGDGIVKETLETMRIISASVVDTAGKMQELEKSSDQIGHVVGVIDDIADQTNMLALNAAIEAARAGEQGRGFAVVADEVRKLAERTSVATKEIAAMIHGIQDEMKAALAAMKAGVGSVERGVQSTTAAGSSLHEIIGMSGRVSDVILQIHQTANRQSGAAEEISSRVSQIAKIAHETASGAGESAKGVQELSSLAFDLQKLVGQFKIGATDAPMNSDARVRPATSKAARGNSKPRAKHAESLLPDAQPPAQIEGYGMH